MNESVFNFADDLKVDEIYHQPLFEDFFEDLFVDLFVEVKFVKFIINLL